VGTQQVIISDPSLIMANRPISEKLTTIPEIHINSDEDFSRTDKSPPIKNVEQPQQALPRIKRTSLVHFDRSTSNESPRTDSPVSDSTSFSSMQNQDAFAMDMAKKILHPILRKNEPAIKIRNAVFGYGKNKTILNHINLSVPQGKIFALLGSSGCGKTTLLRNILGRLKPNSGTVRVFGVEPNTVYSNIPGKYDSTKLSSS